MVTKKRKKIQTKKAPSPRLTINNEDLYQRVALKAYELYQQRGEAHGRDIEDWLTAERFVHEELLHGPIPEEPLVEEQ